MGLQLATYSPGAAGTEVDGWHNIWATHAVITLWIMNIINSKILCTLCIHMPTPLQSMSMFSLEAPLYYYYYYSETCINEHLTTMTSPCIVTTLDSPDRSSNNIITKLGCLFWTLYIPWYDQFFIPTYSVKPCFMRLRRPIDYSDSLWLQCTYKPERLWLGFPLYWVASFTNYTLNLLILNDVLSRQVHNCWFNHLLWVHSLPI